MILKLLVLVLCFSSCNETVKLKKIYLNKTQKIQLEKTWESEYKISYLWSRPEGPENHNSLWIVNDNIMLFTPDQVGNYVITASIENTMGKILGEEKFYYTVLPSKDKNNMLQHNSMLEKSHKTKADIPKHNNQISVNKGFTVQVSSWENQDDAEKNKNYLKNKGFDVYIKKFENKKGIWYRLRVGENLSYDNALQIIKKLEKISIKNTWIDKY